MNQKARVLIVDDEDIVRDSLRDWLHAVGYEVDTADSGEEALRILSRKKVKIMLADLVMPGMNGIELMKKAQITIPTLSTIIITAHATIETAITAMREGAHDYIEKPFCPEKVELLIEKLVAHQQLLEENISLKKQIRDRFRFEGIIAKSPQMSKIIELIKTIAPSCATVLITGETGTGKEVVARAIHHHSGRRERVFIATSCAALPESLLESELFGHEKGAFTGAAERKKGKFEAADGGTLFLDEIGEMNPSTQIHLLRSLEEKRITRIGSNEAIAIDVRFIAATNKDLKALVHQDKFRKDLYYRLKVVSIDIPPIRERREDILPLAEHFIMKYARENGREEINLSPEVVTFMLKYAWPGNARELENMIEHGVLLAKDKTITMAELPRDIFLSSPPDDKTLESVTKNHILKVLEQTQGNITHAARILGIQRMTLYNRLRKYNGAANKLDG